MLPQRRDLPFLFVSLPKQQKRILRRVEREDFGALAGKSFLDEALEDLLRFGLLLRRKRLDSGDRVNAGGNS